METIAIKDQNSYTIALIGNCLTRRCGIATFTTALLSALAAESPRHQYYAVVMNNVSGSYVYPPQVRFEVSEKHLPDYQLAADFLNVNQVNIVFICGAVPEADGSMKVYWDGADTAMCVGECTLAELVDLWLTRSRPPLSHAGSNPWLRMNQEVRGRIDTEWMSGEETGGVRR